MTDTTERALRDAILATDISDQAEALLALIKSTDPEHEPFYINGFVHSLLTHFGKIALIWGIEDVQRIRPDLTIDQIWQVLEHAFDKHDAEFGISWTTLETIAVDRFGDAPETDKAEEA